VFVKGSRYKTARLFDENTVGGSTFRGIRPRSIEAADGVIEHMVREGERLDLLALYYYNDSKRWWRILDANSHILCAADLMLGSTVPDNLIGTVLLIPKSVGEKR